MNVSGVGCQSSRRPKKRPVKSKKQPNIVSYQISKVLNPQTKPCLYLIGETERSDAIYYKKTAHSASILLNSIFVIRYSAVRWLTRLPKRPG